MKSYPSIPRSFREFDAYVFDKIDGSNLRFEWTRKNGWTKFGTRNRLFDSTDPVFGTAIAIFYASMADALASKFVENRYQSAVAFCEFWGQNSFAGTHVDSDEKKLTLFDVAPYKIGLLEPNLFLKHYGHLEIPNFLGKMRWTRGLIDRVRNNKLDGVTFEGVVGKAKHGNNTIMCKAKTNVWIDKLKEIFPQEDAERLANS